MLTHDDALLQSLAAAEDHIAATNDLADERNNTGGNHRAHRIADDCTDSCNSRSVNCDDDHDSSTYSCTYRRLDDERGGNFDADSFGDAGG